MDLPGFCVKDVKRCIITFVVSLSKRAGSDREGMVEYSLNVLLINFYDLSKLKNLFHSPRAFLCVFDKFELNAVQRVGVQTVAERKGSESIKY